MPELEEFLHSDEDHKGQVADEVDHHACQGGQHSLVEEHTHQVAAITLTQSTLLKEYLVIKFLCTGNLIHLINPLKILKKLGCTFFLTLMSHYYNIVLVHLHSVKYIKGGKNNKINLSTLSSTFLVLKLG